MNSKKIMELVLSSRYTSLLYAVIKLQIPELLQNKKLHINKISQLTNTNIDALNRIMRALVSIDIFKETNQYFELSKLSEPLLADSENSIRNIILWIVEWKRKVWTEVLYSVKTGKPAFDYVYGNSLFDLLAKNPAAQELFDKVMTQRTNINSSKIIKTYDFSSAKKIIDIGGGKGLLLSKILKEYNKTNGILFDSFSVISQENNYIKSNNLLSRCLLEKGDFFETIPSGGDIYIIKEVIHDWNDNEVRQILDNCKIAMNKSSKLLIIEHLYDINSPDSTLLDVSMLLTTGGKERSKEEFNKILDESGLNLLKIYDIEGSSLKIIEAEILI